MKYKVGEVIKCTVTGVENYGIFVRTDNSYDGLIHISEVSYDYVRNINDYVKVGEEIFATIIEIDNKNKHMKLSIKEIDYKNSGKKRSEIEDDIGFDVLKEALPVWEEEYLNSQK